MVIKPEELKKEIEKRLKKYEENEIEISGRNYPIHIFEKDEDINLFEGFLFVETDKKAELSDLLNYRPPVSGYTARIGIIIYRNEELIIKDYRANKQIRKTIAKINNPFLKKLKKALEEPKSENISALFSRSDVIEEFYVLYKKCREFLLDNITGIAEEERREEFIDNFMMQMLTLWYLQEKGFFNKDTSYFITKFKELKQKKLTGGFGSYYEFLRHFFNRISGYSDEPYIEDEEIGKCVVIGPAVFLNGEDDPAITIPDKCFYQEGITEKLVNLTPKGRRRMISEKDIDFDVPLLNLFESRDWVDGDIDEYVLGSIYEKLITYMERKKLGAFYTPEEITSYICKNTIEPYLVDRINEEFEKDYNTIDEIINAGEKRELLRLFDLLKDIKILDPAVGSAHFLESAINVLVDIYRKLRDKAEEVGIKSLEILVANEEGKIEPLNLLEIPEKEGLFEVYVKFFIILSRNVYGVDINPSALKVARARLFLTLARHFNVNAGIFIRFPNVHFNLREGNSLIGYVDVPRGKGTKQVTLDFEFEDQEIDYIQERIKVDDELKEYLPEIARSLKVEGDIVKEVEEMNRILASKRIKWGEFERVLRTKEKLIQVLVASLNSRYAVKLNKLLREITELFNRKLDEKFAEEYEIDLEDLKKIKTFHWIFEFPEVFLEKGGFDVVVGNPPYISFKHGQDLEKYLLKEIYASAFRNYDYYVPFIERGISLGRIGGKFGYITSNKFIESRYGEKVKELISKKATIVELIDFADFRVFGGVRNYTCILLLNIDSKTSGKFTKYLILDEVSPDANIEDILSSAKRKLIDIESAKNWEFVDKLNKEIIDFCLRQPKLVEFAKVYEGVRPGPEKAYVLDSIREELESKIIKPFIKTKNIDRYVICWQNDSYIIFPYDDDLNLVNLSEFPQVKGHLDQFINDLYDNKGKGGERYEYYHCPKEVLNKNKIITPDIAKSNEFAIDVLGSFIFPNTLYGMSFKAEYKGMEKSILLLLNSSLIEFIIRNWSPKIRGGYLRYKTEYLQELPIIAFNKNSIEFLVSKILCNYLLQIYNVYTQLESKTLKELIDFLEAISNNIVYELYFKQKFIEDSKKAIEEGEEPIYPQLENGPFLIDLVAKYLKPIDYDSYAKLAYSIEPLSEEEKQRMEKMKEEYLKTIKEVVEAIKADKEIMGLIERIKQHEWVRVIEGGN